MTRPSGSVFPENTRATPALGIPVPVGPLKITKTVRSWRGADGVFVSRRVAVIESELFIVCTPRSPESVSDVGCATTVTSAAAPEPACVASPAKLAVSRYTPGLSAARTGTVTWPFVPVVTGIPEAPPRPTRTFLP